MEKSASIQNSITLVRFKTEKFKLFNDSKDVAKSEKSNKIDLNFSYKIHKLNERLFKVLYMLELKRHDDLLNIDCHFATFFSTESVISDEFFGSDFIQKNSVAIGFPYLRSFISSVTLSCNIKPIILPTFNFSNNITEEVTDEEEIKKLIDKSNS